MQEEEQQEGATEGLALDGVVEVEEIDDEEEGKPGSAVEAILGKGARSSRRPIRFVSSAPLTTRFHVPRSLVETMQLSPRAPAPGTKGRHRSWFGAQRPTSSGRRVSRVWSSCRCRGKSRKLTRSLPQRQQRERQQRRQVERKHDRRRHQEVAVHERHVHQQQGQRLASSRVGRGQDEQSSRPKSRPSSGKVETTSSILRRFAQEKTRRARAHKDAVRRRQEILHLGAVSRKDHAKALQHARVNRMRLVKENERKERLMQAQRAEMEKQDARGRAHAQRHASEDAPGKSRSRNVAVPSSLFDPDLPLPESQYVSFVGDLESEERDPSQDLD